MSDAAVHSAPMGGDAFSRDMARLRHLLAPGFTPKRMHQLEGWIQELTDDCLDAMQTAHDSAPAEPVNFHDHLGWRLPVLVISAMLGVPNGDREYVMELSDQMGDLHGGTDAKAAAADLREYMRRLIDMEAREPVRGRDLGHDCRDRRRPDVLRGPADRVLRSGAPVPWTRNHRGTSGLRGAVPLSDPARRDWLMVDPDARIASTVEEILRMTSAHNLGLLRWALEDVEIGGVEVKRGELVIISESAANRDPKIFPEPDSFDAAREGANHLAFGHGSHVCLGQSLARTELRIVFPSLFRRFPDIRLACDASTLQIRNDRTGGGVDQVPVTW